MSEELLMRGEVGSPAAEGAEGRTFGGAAPPPTGPVHAARMVDLSGSDHVPGQKRSGPSRRALADGEADGEPSAIRGFVTSMSVMHTYMSGYAKALVAVVFVAALLMWAMSAVVLYRQYKVLKTMFVDGTVCHGRPFTEIKTNSVGYSVASIAIGTFFVLWYALRAVRLEKAPLLLVFAFAAAVVAGRSLYFAFVVADTSLTEPVVIAARACYAAASGLLAVGVLLAIPTSRNFGWRTYAKGVTQLSEVETLSRYKQFDACAKFDLYITVSAFLSLFFFASSTVLRVCGLLVALPTVGFLLAINTIIKRHLGWLVYVFGVVCFLMPPYYIAVTVIYATQARGHCWGTAATCLSTANITTVAVGADMPPAVPGNTTCGTPTGCWVPQQCLAYGGNATAYAECVAGSAAASFGPCCSEYGRCELKQSFFDNDEPLLFVTAGLGIFVRAATLVLAVRQVREMRLPTIQDALRRGERNLRSFGVQIAQSLPDRRPQEGL